MAEAQRVQLAGVFQNQGGGGPERQAGRFVLTQHWERDRIEQREGERRDGRRGSSRVTRPILAVRALHGDGEQLVQGQATLERGDGLRLHQQRHLGKSVVLRPEAGCT